MIEYEMRTVQIRLNEFQIVHLAVVFHPHHIVMGVLSSTTVFTHKSVFIETDQSIQQGSLQRIGAQGRCTNA